jgi:SAM-dependent methyltransferase
MTVSDLSGAITKNADQNHLAAHGVDRRVYDLIYRAGDAPWETGEPQPEVVAIAARGGFRGRVLDVGCGLGTNALFLARSGLSVLGLDFVPEVIDVARGRAVERGLDGIRFVAGDIFLQDPAELGRFDTILDCATLHGFSDAERQRYAASLHSFAAAGATLHVIGIGRGETRPGGPRRLSRETLEEVFRHSRWEMVECRECFYTASIFPGGARAVAAELRAR